MNPAMLENIRHQFPWAPYVHECVHVEATRMTVWYGVSLDGQAWIDVQMLQAHRQAWGEFPAPTPEEIETWTREALHVMVEAIQRSRR